MPIASVELILFAAQAGIKLIQTGRKVYVEATIGGEVDVPLPPSFEKTPVEVASNYAASVKEEDLKRFERDYKNAWDKSRSADASVAADGRWLLVQQYLADMSQGLVKACNRNTAEVASIFVLKQWEQSKSPFPSAVQRIAGSLVEISIAYFLNVPGALNENSKQGKAVKSFLQGLADVDFQDPRLDSIAVALFTTALDTLKDYPDLITDQADYQSLIQMIVAGVASDASEKLKTTGPGDLDAEARLRHFSQIVLRSLLKNGATAILGSPARLGITDQGGRVLIQSVGSAFLDLLLEDESAGLTDNLRKIASTEGFDRLIGAALKAVVEYPDHFITGDEAVDKWLKGVISDIYERSEKGWISIGDPDLFVEIAYFAIDNGVRDLPFLLASHDGQPALLIEMTRQVFDRLTVPPAADQPPRVESLQLSRTELKELFGAVLASVVTDLSWLTQRPELQKEATSLIPLMVSVLGDLHADALKALIRSDRLAAVMATILVSEIFQSAGDTDEEKIAAGLKAVLIAVRDNGINGAQRLLDKNVLFDLLSALVRSGAAAKLFGGNQTDIEEALAKLMPILEKLRQGQVLPVAWMVEKL